MKELEVGGPEFQKAKMENEMQQIYEALDDEETQKEVHDEFEEAAKSKLKLICQVYFK